MGELTTTNIYEYIFSDQIKNNDFLHKIDKEILYQETCFGNKILNLCKVLEDQKLLYFMEFEYSNPDQSSNTTYTSNTFDIFNPRIIRISMKNRKFVYPDELKLVMTYYNFAELRDVPILERKAITL